MGKGKIFLIFVMVVMFAVPVNASSVRRQTPGVFAGLPQPTEGEIEFDGINFAEGFRRGINFGNMLEAPKEGEWGVRVEDDYFGIVKELGFDFIRLPVRWNNYTNRSNTINETFFKRVDHVVEQAVNHGLGLIINIHHFEELNIEPEANKEKLFSIWRQVSNRYSGTPLNVIFQINNEPHTNITNELWNELQNACIEIIRETNPTRKILVNGADWGGPGSIPEMVLPTDDNLIADFHFYDPFQFTHQGAEWTNNADYLSWVGTEWFGTDEEINILEQTFISMKAWSEATGVPVIMGEFGSFSPADMESRERWTTSVRLLAEEYGFAWSYWEFASGFGIYDPERKRLREPLVRALVGLPFPDNYGTKTGGFPQMVVYESDGFFGPTRYEIAVDVKVDSWAGISTEISPNSTKILTLNGPNAVPDWASVRIMLDDISDTRTRFSHNTIELTVRNINDSITHLGINLEVGVWDTENYFETSLLRLVKNDLTNGNGLTSIKNEDGSLTIFLNIGSVYRSFKGRNLDDLRLKLFIESMPDSTSHYDRLGSIEFISMEFK